MSVFDPSPSRRGLDLLLVMHPHFDLVNAGMPDEQSPWLLVDLGQPSTGDAPAWAVWQFAIWRATGAVYRVAGGAVDDDPFIEPQLEIGIER